MVKKRVERMAGVAGIINIQLHMRGGGEREGEGGGGAVYLEEVGELGVTVGDVWLLGGQGGEDVPKAGEGLVDGAGLLLVLPLHLRPCQPLTAPTTTCHAMHCRKDHHTALDALQILALELEHTSSS